MAKHNKKTRIRHSGMKPLAMVNVTYWSDGSIEVLQSGSLRNRMSMFDMVEDYILDMQEEVLKLEEKGGGK